MKRKAVIVDDEQPICDEIEYLLKEHLDIEVCAKFSNCVDALIYIVENKPEIIFLDVKMPGMSGLELAKKLSCLDKTPYIIFISAYPEHAIDAFDTLAVGYVTKPITHEKLNKSLAKVRTLSAKVPAPAERTNQIAKVCVISNGKIVPVNKKDIVFIYVKDKDVYVRTKSSEFSTPLTLQEFDNLLTEANFLRIHRQYIINLDEVLEIIPWFNGSYLLSMNDLSKQEVPVSRSRVKRLKTALGLK